MENQSTFTLSLQDAKDLSFRTRDEAVDIIIRLQEERDVLQAENARLKQAVEGVVDSLPDGNLLR